MQTFFIWWFMILLLGVGFMPLTHLVFAHFSDHGWIFSKVLGIAITGFLTWVGVCSKLLSFTTGTCLAIAMLCIMLNWVVWFRRRKKGERLIITRQQWQLILLEEILFLLVFFMWSWMAGFHPAAYGTEKFMDYGFMAAMMRSERLPATDLWYAGSTINYYYGGQYYAVFLTKLSGTRVAETYNLMRTMVAAFAFTLPSSLVRQMWMDRKSQSKKIVTQQKQALAVGLLAGAAVSLCGNMHYVIIGKIRPWINKIFSQGDATLNYWFPNSTRYLGHYPKLNDRTIHEFPSYSFVLGDLHAHVVNIMFVLTVIGILYAWVSKAKAKQRILDWPLVVLTFFIGIFQWTNYWDFIIYMVVVLAVALYLNIRNYQGVKIIGVTAAQMFVMVVGALVVALPFTLQFDSMVSSVALVQSRSIFYQYLILWGLPILLSVAFIIGIFSNYHQQPAGEKTGRFRSFFLRVPKVDAFVVILVVCALGLILIPEFVYVRDIYEENSARANTMFKLTYQAYMLFGIGMAYIVFHFLVAAKKRLKVIGIVGLLGIAATLCYFGTAVNSWFGHVFDPAGFTGLDATAFLEQDFPEDAAAIRWLNEHVEGSPVVLEANGDSYSDCERVSAMTGLPTVLGWYVHEWLWRGDIAALNQRGADVETIYTTDDREQLEQLIQEYEIAYIFVGSQERQKYENINETMMQSLGEIVFAGDGAYIIAISN